MSFIAPKGILETAIRKLRSDAWHVKPSGEKSRYVTLESIANFNYTLQLAKYDSHTIVTGANGTGKSYVQFALIKRQLEVMKQPLDFAIAEKAGKLKFLYAYNTRKQFVNEIKSKQNCIFGIDELRTFFEYRRTSLGDQIDLYNAIEVARSHFHCYIGCTRDLNRIDNNYRNAKAALLIRLWDRVADENDITKTKYVYGSVFVGNPAVEMEDKFMQYAFNGSNSIEYSLKIAEQLPTYIGPIVVRDVHQYGVTDNDITLYEIEKEKGIQKYSNVKLGKPREKHGLAKT